ncbi:MAG: hypothetical protein FWC51_01535 [Proteobacteria bacterium]|nr:hypothetical protein [Pseudomonadota bacterium]
MNLMQTWFGYLYKGPLIAVSEPQLKQPETRTDNYRNIDVTRIVERYNAYFPKNPIVMEENENYAPPPVYVVVVTYKNWVGAKEFFGDPGTPFEEQKAAAKSKAESFYNETLAKTFYTIEK